MLQCSRFSVFTCGSNLCTNVPDYTLSTSRCFPSRVLYNCKSHAVDEKHDLNATHINILDGCETDQFPIDFGQVTALKITNANPKGWHSQLFIKNNRSSHMINESHETRSSTVATP